MTRRRVAARRRLVAPALLAASLAVSWHGAAGGGGVPSQLSVHIGAGGVGSDPRGPAHHPPPPMDCRWTDRGTGASWDLRSLSLPHSAYVFHDEMTDLAHDSVHAAQRAAERAAAPEAKPKAVSGRLLDAGIIASKADAESKDVAARPTLNARVHHHNPDAYDFHVNVCANVAHKPPVCADKPDAPGYQLVVPKAVEEAEDDSSDFSEYGAFDADDGAALAGEADGDAGGTHPHPHAGDMERWRRRQTEPVHRAARPAPEPTECHALGSLRNATFGLISPAKPELGLELRYAGGDDCLKRVLKKREGGASGASASALPEVTWVPTPRTLTLRLRCDPLAPGGIDPFDPASAMQLARRVRFVEAEMCEYEADWPTSAACPTLKPAVAAVVAAKARRAVLPAMLALGLAAAVVTQAARHRRTLRALGRRVRAGDTGALRAVMTVLMSKDSYEASRGSRRHSSAGHEI